VVLVALVLLGVAVLGFVKPAFFVPAVAHQTSVRSGPAG
jgi:Tfp pilus assembly protein PilV